jgi:hypothetical protein
MKKFEVLIAVNIKTGVLGCNTTFTQFHISEFAVLISFAVKTSDP